MKKVARITVVLLLTALMIDCYVCGFIGVSLGFWQGLGFLILLGAIDFILVTLIFVFLSLHNLNKEQKERKDGSHR